MDNTSTVSPASVTFLSSDEPVFRLMYLILVSIATACGNVLVLVAVLRFKSLRRTTNVMLGSLAFADLLIGIVTVPFYIVWTINPVVFDRSSFMCGFVLLSCLLMVTASQISLLCLSVEQYFAVCYPFQHRAFLIRYPWLHIVAVGVTWIISFVTTALSSFAFNTSATTCNYYGAFNKTFLFVASLAGIFLPFIAIIIFNAKVLCVVRDHDKRRRISNESEKPSFSNSSSSKNEAISDAKGEGICSDKSFSRKISGCNSWSIRTRVKRSISSQKTGPSSVILNDNSGSFYESLKLCSSPSELMDSTHCRSPTSRDDDVFCPPSGDTTPNQTDLEICHECETRKNGKQSSSNDSLDVRFDQFSPSTSSKDTSPIKPCWHGTQFSFDTARIYKRKSGRNFQRSLKERQKDVIRQGEYTLVNSSDNNVETFDITTETVATTEITNINNNKDYDSVRKYGTVRAQKQNHTLKKPSSGSLTVQTPEKLMTHSHSDSQALSTQCHTKINAFFKQEKEESKTENFLGSSDDDLLEKDTFRDQGKNHEYFYELTDYSRRIRSYSDSRYRLPPTRCPPRKSSLFSLSQSHRSKPKSSVFSQVARRTSSVLSIGFFRGREESCSSEMVNPSRQVSGRVARMVALVCASFILAWLPLFVVIFINTFCVECNLVYYLNAVVMVAFTKSVSNPIIYALCHVAFRRAYNRVLSSLCFVRRTANR